MIAVDTTIATGRDIIHPPFDMSSFVKQNVPFVE